MSDELKNAWLWISAGDLETELRQLEEEGIDARAVEREIKVLIKKGDTTLFKPAYQKKTADLYLKIDRLPRRKGYGFLEPSDLPSIKKARPSGRSLPRLSLSDGAMKDAIHGAWLGRCIGCLLGKAAEGIRTDHLWPFLKASGQWPLRDYIRFGGRSKAHTSDEEISKRAWADDIGYMPIDDDTNYTTTGVMIVEKYGPDFTPAAVAQFWMENIPILATCTAERVAYQNFAANMAPPQSARFQNPYREWIGAQIRADGFAYVCAGNPQRAAEFGWRDASISHIKNGIYGEMFMAAMIAAAPLYKTVPEVLEAGLNQIPRHCRLGHAVRQAMAWHAEGFSYDEAVAKIHAIWNEKSFHDWCHTISNAVICVVALLWGNGDFEDSVCKAVQPCFDTDCNGATVGSIVGMMIGAKKIPVKWKGRLHDTLHTSLQGNTVVKISEIAERTFKIWKKIR